MNTIALIPTYQPTEELVDVVDQLTDAGIMPVVIDDGSGPAYADILGRAEGRAVVLGYTRNLGKGYALKLGLDYVAVHHGGDTVVVTVDGDGQHAAADAVRCAREAAAHPGSLVLGCRDFAAEGVPARSRLGNVVTRGVYRLASGVAVRDTQTGLRAFGVDLVDFLVKVAGDRYEWETNVLLACPSEGVAIREVPIATIYRDGNAASHFRVVRDSLRIYGGILRFVAASFAGFCIDYLLFFWLVGTLGAALANVCARLASASANFALNRALVFRSNEAVGVVAARYALVAAGILLGNTVAIAVLVDAMGVPAPLAKPAVELIFFLCSWTLQSRFVFRRRIAHAF